MKKFLLIVVWFLICINVNAQEPKVHLQKIYYPDGTLEAVYTLKGNIVEGLYQKYNKKGQLEHEDNYINNQPGKSAKIYRYHENGKLEYEYSFDSGEGYTKYYYEDGNIWKKIEIHKGLYENYQEFNKMGNLVSEQKGLFSGKLDTYDEDGKFLKQKTFENGHLDFKDFAEAFKDLSK